MELEKESSLHGHSTGRKSKNKRDEVNDWLIEEGVGKSYNDELSISPCPFTDDEISELEEKGYLVLCVPKGVTAEELADAFDLPTWAAEDPLVSEDLDPEDDWFATPGAIQPPHTNKTAREINRQFDENNVYGFSLRRYLVFLARVRYLTGELPDKRWWTWLLRTRYDRSGILIAGIDRLGHVSAHGWMSDFKAKFCGARFCVLPDTPWNASTKINPFT